MIDRIELKNMHSKELRMLRNMIREELDFRADVGSEIANREVWMSSTEWGEKVQELLEKENKEERERTHAYIEDNAHSHIRDRMESMRDWDREGTSK